MTQELEISHSSYMVQDARSWSYIVTDEGQDRNVHEKLTPSIPAADESPKSRQFLKKEASSAKTNDDAHMETHRLYVYSDGVKSFGVVCWNWYFFLACGAPCGVGMICTWISRSLRGGGELLKKFDETSPMDGTPRE